MYNIHFEKFLGAPYSDISTEETVSSTCDKIFIGQGSVSKSCVRRLRVKTYLVPDAQPPESEIETRVAVLVLGCLLSLVYQRTQEK